jgi:hypothetical protein
VTATGLQTRTFQVTITPEATVRQAISNVTTQIVKKGSAKLMTINYTTTSGGIANLGLYQNGVKVANIITNEQIIAGKNTVSWGMMTSHGQTIKPGTYTLSISAVGDGGDVATKYVTLNL